MRIVGVGRFVFATIMTAIGIMGLTRNDFAPVWEPVPKDLAAREVLAHASALVSLLSGIGLLWPRTAAPSARLLLAALLLWLLWFRIPVLFHRPEAMDSWEGCAETVVILAGVWALYAANSSDWDRRHVRFASGTSGANIARALYGLAMIPFGLAHFAYVKETASLVPGWLPGPVAWVYLTGSAYIAAGVALVTKVCAQWAAVLSALQMGLFTLLVWVPIVMAAHSVSAFQWSETVISAALTAAAWAVADMLKAKGLIASTQKS